jgi:hypothetical protein
MNPPVPANPTPIEQVSTYTTAPYNPNDSRKFRMCGAVLLCSFAGLGLGWLTAQVFENIVIWVVGGYIAGNVTQWGIEQYIAYLNARKEVRQ